MTAERIPEMQRHIKDLQQQVAALPQRLEDGSQRIRWGLAKITDVSSSAGAGAVRVYGIRYISATFDEVVGFQDLAVTELHSDDLFGGIASECLDLDVGSICYVLEMNGLRWLIPWCPTVQGGGGPNEGFVTTRALNASLVLSWSADYGTTTYGVGSPPSATTTIAWVCGDSIDDNTLILTGREYDSSGAETGTTVDIGAFRQNQIVVDASDNVYGLEAGTGSTIGTITKWNSAGTVLWTVSDAPYLDIAVDGSGNVYACTDALPLTFAFIYKYDSSGTFQWAHQMDLGDPLNSIAVEAGNTFVVAVSSFGWVNKITSGGLNDSATQATSLAPLFSVAIDSLDNVFVGGDSANSSSLEKFDSDILSLATHDTGGTVFGVAIDSGDLVYACGTTVSAKTLWALPNDLSSVAFSYDHGSTLRDVIWDFTNSRILATGNRVAL